MEYIGGKKVNTKTKRWFKDVGLGFRTPAGEFIGIMGLSGMAPGIAIGGWGTTPSYERRSKDRMRGLEDRSSRGIEDGRIAGPGALPFDPIYTGYGLSVEQH